MDQGRILIVFQQKQETTIEHYKPDDYNTSGKDICCAWVVAAVLMTIGFTLLSL